MRRLRFILSIFLLVWFGVGCSGLQITFIPSPKPMDHTPTIKALPTQVGQIIITIPTRTNTPVDIAPPATTQMPQGNTNSGDNTATPLAFNPTQTSSPSPSATSTVDLSATVTRRPTRTPSITPTPAIPNAGVQIDMPGPMSKVTSPLHLVANLRSIPSGSYHVELWAEPLQPGGEPRLLYREVRELISNPVPWVYLDQQIEFELERVSEYGQLRVAVLDQYERTVSINSVNLILLSMGPSEITPVAGVSEPIVIRAPTLNQLIQGGKVIVSGLAKPTEDFMLAELVAIDGTVVGYRQVFVSQSVDGSYTPFTAEVPYQLESATWVRLQLSESGTRITGVEHMSSVQVLLSP